MGRFLLGLLVGLVVGAGAMYLVGHFEAGTPSITAAPPSSAPDAGRGKKRRRAEPQGAINPSPSEDLPVSLTNTDRQAGAEGDTLRASPTTVDMSDSAAQRELTQSEIDAAFAQKSDALTGCITEARGPAPLSGRIVAGVVIDGSGRVIRTRIEAPNYLLHHGLYICARRALVTLRFPAIGRETVVTVPIDLSE